MSTDLWDGSGGTQAEWRFWWASSRQRATQPVGTTVTVMRRPQSGQKRGGSNSRAQPWQSVEGRPQPVQWVQWVRVTDPLRWRR